MRDLDAAYYVPTEQPDLVELFDKHGSFLRVTSLAYATYYPIPPQTPQPEVSVEILTDYDWMKKWHRDEYNNIVAFASCLDIPLKVKVEEFCMPLARRMYNKGGDQTAS